MKWMPLEDQGKESELITVTGHGTAGAVTDWHKDLFVYIYRTVLKLSVI